MIKLITVFIITFIVSSCSKDTIIHPETDAHIIIPDSSGRINMYSDLTKDILPGSTIYLVGNFLSVRFTGLRGLPNILSGSATIPGKSLQTEIRIGQEELIPVPFNYQNANI